MCASTNDVALVHARAGAAHGTVVIADAQTAGRGRLGRTWVSPAGTNLYLSAVVRAARPTSELAPLTLAIGIGVVDAVRTTGVGATLKWPNDVLAGATPRKLAGILCEVAGDRCVVAGIGVNVNVHAPSLGTGVDSDDLRTRVELRATSIADERQAAVDRAAFTEVLFEHVEPWIDRFLDGGVPAIAAAWEARMTASLVLRVERGSSRGPITGTAVGLDRDGALRLRSADGVIQRIHAGDAALA